MPRKLRTDLDELIREFYSRGLSTREISTRVKLSCSRTAAIVKRLGISRSRSEALILKGNREPGSIHWRTLRNRARKIWERNNGPIPDGYHIHHKDGDYRNNEIQNLELLSAREHAHRHRPPNPIPRWMRPERREYMLRYLRDYGRRRREEAKASAHKT